MTATEQVYEVRGSVKENDMQEQWRPIVGYAEYEVSDLGRVRSTQHNTPRILKHDSVKGGYERVTLCNNGKNMRFFVHRLVMDAFVGPAPLGMCAAHNNGNPKDNRASNLRWATRRENEMDKRGHGTAPVGSRNNMAKLTEDAVAAIRNEPSTPRIALANRYGVSISTIKKIRHGSSWAHVSV